MVDRRPTIADVAAHAGVSLGAVSFALNGRSGVGEETRQRILASARELGWRPSQHARSLSTSRALALGLVLARTPEAIRADPFFPAFIGGVETVLSPRSLSLVLQVVPDIDAEIAGYRRLAAERRVDGVFLTDLRQSDPRVALLAEIGLPAVTLNRPDVDSPHPAICLDDRTGIAAAVRHLIELGHTRIAHVGGPAEFLHGTGRREAWAATLAEAGAAPDPFVESDFTAAGGAAATRTLLDLAEPPTAIVYANDLMAVAGMAVAQGLGLAVPGDLSVTGFDDTELSAYVHPALTTVRTDPFGWGQVAARVLLDLVESDEAGDEVLDPAALVVRETTGPVPA